MTDPLTETEGGLPPLTNYSPDREYGRQTAPFYETSTEHNQWLSERHLPRSLPLPHCAFPSLDLPDPGAPSEEFIEAYQQNTSWLSYLLSLQAKVTSEKLAVDNVLDITRAQLRTDLRASSDSRGRRGSAGSLTNEDIDARILINPRYQDAMLRLQKVLTRLADLKALSTALQRNIESISRTITLRGQDLYLAPPSGKIPPPAPRTRTPPSKASPSYDDEL